MQASSQALDIRTGETLWKHRRSAPPTTPLAW